ncbi:hypothetical protein [Rhodococcus sp. 1168]|uniref:hypothetical protein n=1 Tax=Rhodococcus sp. 1168 TaxID=2018041 RepID=UPI000B5AFDB8|nr:hypothetical protein [Rhodococcus sp. 1168]
MKAREGTAHAEGSGSRAGWIFEYVLIGPVSRVLGRPRRIKFVAKSEYFSGHWMKGRLIRWFYTSAGQVPIDRSGSDAGEPAPESARKMLSDNGIWELRFTTDEVMYSLMKTSGQEYVDIYAAAAKATTSNNL